MSPGRKITLILTSVALRSTLFFGLFCLALIIIFTNSSSIKQTVAESGAYERLVPAALETANHESSKGLGDSSIPLDNPEIQKVINSSFDTNNIKQQSENFIDGVYAWLNGKTSGLEFKIDLTSNKDRLADNLSTYAANRMKGLPVCTSIPTETNIFLIPCRPPGVNLDREQAIMRQTLATNPNLLADAVFTSDDLPKNSDGTRVPDNLKHAPEIYKWFKLIPWICLMLAILLSIIIIKLSPTMRSGVKTVGSSLIIAGLLLGLTALIYSYIANKFTQFLQNDVTAKGFDGIIGDIAKHVSSDVNQAMLIISAVTILVGVTIRVVLYFTKIDNSAASKDGIARN
jgi:hypothetical protein